MRNPARKSLFERVLGKLRDGDLLASLRRRLQWKLRSRHERYLDGAKGVIHVGANIGQERDTYALCHLRVLWIEADPSTYSILRENICSYPGQRAFQSLITDRDDESYDFHIANNGGGSSSIMDLSLHRDIWPRVEFERTLRLQGSTLTSLMFREGVEPSEFDVLVMDTQGSELLVLKGAESILSNFRYIRTEAADFDAYTGGCRLDELSNFLSVRGFAEVYRNEFAKHPAGGRYYDVLFRRAKAIPWKSA